jgi:hypothetical protein
LTLAEGFPPDAVYAQGDLKFYGKKNAEERGVTQFYSRAHGSEAAINADSIAKDTLVTEVSIFVLGVQVD